MSDRKEPRVGEWVELALQGLAFCIIVILLVGIFAMLTPPPAAP